MLSKDNFHQKQATNLVIIRQSQREPKWGSSHRRDFWSLLFKIQASQSTIDNILQISSSFYNASCKYREKLTTVSTCLKRLLKLLSSLLLLQLQLNYFPPYIFKSILKERIQCAQIGTLFSFGLLLIVINT